MSVMVALRHGLIVNYFVRNDRRLGMDMDGSDGVEMLVRSNLCIIDLRSISGSNPIASSQCSLSVESQMSLFRMLDIHTQAVQSGKQSPAKQCKTQKIMSRRQSSKACSSCAPAYSGLIYFKDPVPCVPHPEPSARTRLVARATSWLPRRWRDSHRLAQRACS